MSKEFEDWCGKQLYKLCGSRDLTLVQFLMTVESPEEIKEYIHSTLGHKAGVSQFITGFLANKDFATEASTKAKKKSRTVEITNSQTTSRGAYAALASSDGPMETKSSSAAAKKKRRRRKKK